MNAHTSARFLLILLFALVLTGIGQPLHAAPAAPPPADSPPSAVVTTGRLNVRTGPGVGYTIVTRIDQGAVISLLARNTSASWVKLRLPSGVEGWVNASYIRASVPLADLPVNTSTSPTPTPAPAAPTGAVTVAQIDLRAGPGNEHSVLASLGQGQALTLLGRTADSSWVKVRATGKGEGWIPALVKVVVPGNENGVSTTTFHANASLSSLPVVTAPASPQPSVSLSTTAVRPATPVYITVASFPANRDVAAVLTSRLVPAGFVVATGRTDANGAAQLFFRMPDAWPSGAQITESGLSLAVGTVDGAVLIWSGLGYSR